MSPVNRFGTVESLNDNTRQQPQQMRLRPQQLLEQIEQEIDQKIQQKRINREKDLFPSQQILKNDINDINDINESFKQIQKTLEQTNSEM
jgi:hypothetical protein